MRLLAPLLALVLLPAAAHAAEPPKTGFEQRNGASFTTYDEEQAFLAEVDAASERVAVDTIATTAGERSMDLVRIGAPAPTVPAQARRQPTALLVCSQHGNEPAGREACLQRVRDLAFTTDPTLTQLLETTTLLVVPSANPDGRARNSRGNANGTDVNRDHLSLGTDEARAMAEVVRVWEPDVAIDLHEYGPSQPVLYDDAVLWLWPRNLNVDPRVHDLAIELGEDYLVPAAEAKGYGADEYGQYEVADNDVHQTAGDGDEGIMRNAMGLRHVLGILVETRVDADVRQSALELLERDRVARRRVASHAAVLDGLVTFLRERGPEAAAITAAASAEAADDPRPVFFGGADNQPATPAQTAARPCGYGLTAEQVEALGPRLDLHGIRARIDERTGAAVVPTAQPAEPVIPLLLDARATRNVVEGEPLTGCPGPPEATRPTFAPSEVPNVGQEGIRRAARTCTEPRSVVLPVPDGASVRVAGRAVRPQGGVVVVRLTRPDQAVPVVIGGREQVVRACG